MKNMKKVVILWGLLVLLAVAAVGNGQSDVSEESVVTEISYLSADAGRVVKKDNPVVAVYEEKFDIRLNMELLDGDSYKQKIPIVIASGDLPDMMRLNGYEHFDYVTQDVFMDLTDKVKSYQNIMKYVDPQAWNLTSYKGKAFCIPSANYTGKYITAMRKDWLDNLGMDIPETIDEYYDVLKAFTFDDPDGNGKDDTFGIGTQNGSRSESFMNTYGAFGGTAGYNVIKGNSIVTFDISEEYRNALRFVKRLYDEGILDPESLIHKQAQGREKLVQGRIGTFTGWWSIVPQVLTVNLKMPEVTPGAEWVRVPPLTGPKGDSGMVKRNLVNYSIVLAKETDKDEKILDFLNYLISDEGAWLSFLGIEGVHWTETAQGKVRTELGQKAFEEKWLDVLHQTVLRSDIVLPWYAEQDPAKRDYILKAQEWGTVPEAFEGIITKEMQQYKGEVSKFTDEAFIRFIVGDLSLDDDWDRYVSQWKERGGEAMRQSQLAVYNENKGTDLTFRD